MADNREPTAREAFEIIEHVAAGGTFPEWLTKDQVSRLMDMAQSRHRLQATVAERLAAESRDNRRAGSKITNSRYQESCEAARAIAADLVAGDTDRVLRKAALIERVRDELIRLRHYAPQDDETLWSRWLKATPSVIPAYMSKGGRPPKK